MKRENPFDDLDVLPAQNQAKPVDTAAIDRLAEASGFVSRQPGRAKQGATERPTPPVPAQLKPRSAPRRFTTGRNQQFNIKAKPEAIERFYRLAEERKVRALGELLEQALDALEGVTPNG